MLSRIARSSQRGGKVESSAVALSEEKGRNAGPFSAFCRREESSIRHITL